ncbi:hypothetical protein BJD12_19290 [Xanthomonas vesicatoria ATCC 35937]|nr:hypothetical protein BJD12_19290 [Xanthomonas vesicatoria ATCC 35937]KTF32299.1 hypothetical protein LMG920_13485 [Xanthomonas vesicatoria]
MIPRMPLPECSMGGWLVAAALPHAPSTMTPSSGCNQAICLALQPGCSARALLQECVHELG